MAAPRNSRSTSGRGSRRLSAASELALELVHPGLEDPEHDPGTVVAKQRAATVQRSASARVPTEVPRPRIRSRKRWGADESWRDGRPRYIRSIRQVHVTITESGPAPGPDSPAGGRA